MTQISRARLGDFQARAELAVREALDAADEVGGVSPETRVLLAIDIAVASTLDALGYTLTLEEGAQQ